MEHAHQKHGGLSRRTQRFSRKTRAAMDGALKSPSAACARDLEAHVSGGNHRRPFVPFRRQTLKGEVNRLSRSALKRGCLRGDREYDLAQNYLAERVHKGEC